jgi:hypothetical protein
MGWPRIRWFCQILEDIKKEKNKLAKPKRKSYEKEEETGCFPSINLYNTEVMVQSVSETHFP